MVLALLALAAFALPAAAEEKTEEPPPPVQVSVGPSRQYPQVPVTYYGQWISENHREAKGMQWNKQFALFPDPGQPLVYQMTITAHGAERSVHLTGKICANDGREVSAVDVEATAKDGETATAEFSFTPKESDAGPFFFIGNWQEAAGSKGSIPEGGFESSLPAVVAMPNTRYIADDFECVRWPERGAEVENSPTAAHSGKLGIVVRPQLPENYRPREGVTPIAKYTLAIGQELKGRPVRIGVWTRCDKPTKMTLRLRDPGIEVSQIPRYDRWAVGPIELQPGDWQYVAFPAPGYEVPKWQRKTSGRLAEGFVDYPLIVESLDIECEAGGNVMLDELDVFTQGVRSAAVTARPITNKPASLLYPNDSLRLALCNGWMWGEPIELSYKASLMDIADREWPVLEGKTKVAPGKQAILEANLNDLPLGSYRLKAAVKQQDRLITSIDQSRGFVVYQPQGKALPQNELAKFLSDRLSVIADLGYTQDQMIIPWHSTDGSASVEPTQGYWYFSWLDPELQDRRAKGIELIGQLGLTPDWADPGVTFLSISNTWAGNTTVMPGRKIYWEEYVYRSVDWANRRIKNWIVWPRPDTPEIAGNPTEFVERMVSVAHKAAKEADPSVKLISGGISRHNQMEFLNGLIEAGAGRYLDAVGLLPTTTPLSPEDGYMDVALNRVQRLFEEEQFGPEMWVLNLGWPTGDGDGCVTENDQARYIARAWTICRATGVAKVLVEPNKVYVDYTGIAMHAVRDSADLIFSEGGLYGIKPAALAVRTVRSMLADAEFVKEVFLVDRWDGLSRAYLFRRADGKLVLSAWRRHEKSTLDLTGLPVEKVVDIFGNELKSDATRAVVLHPAPQYIVFSATDADRLAVQLERTPLQYEDAAESAWKKNWTFYLDIGNEADQKAVNYQLTNGRRVGQIDSHYHNDYGRHVVDSGVQFETDVKTKTVASEQFEVDVSTYGSADMVIRKRIDYALPDQCVKVYCNGTYVGQWFAFKRDRRFRWRNIDFIIPNSAFAGKKKAVLRFEAKGGAATSFAYWAAPLKTRTVYASDMSLLVNSSGYGAGVNIDANILGGPISFSRGGQKTYRKGIGTNAASSFDQSLIVLPLNKQFKRFKATVGIDAATGGKGSVRFRIGDGLKLLYDSKDMTYFSEPQEIDIDVSDAIILMLTTGDSGDGNKNDIANWADARLEVK